MRVKIQQFLFGGTLFSWAIVGQNIGRAFMKLGHDVEFVSTDGIQDRFVPDDIKNFVRKVPSGLYDCQVSYTAMHNFGEFLRHGRKNRFGIWNYDGTIIPPNMIKHHRFCDRLLPSSDFSRDVFIKNRVPEEKIITVPHGINLEEFATDKKYPLTTSRSKKILLNIATPHRRKNLKNTLWTYGGAFTKEDDVCLVVKVNLKKQKDSQFYVDFDKTLSDFKKKFPNHGDVEVVAGFIPNLAELYNACDIVFQMSNLECWWLPGTEAFSAGKLVVASRHGGQLHYLNDNNSLLIDGEIVRMRANYQYWMPSAHGEMFEPSIDDGISKLRQAVLNYDELITKFRPNMQDIVKQFTWDNVAQKIISIME